VRTAALVLIGVAAGAGLIAALAALADTSLFVLGGAGLAAAFAATAGAAALAGRGRRSFVVAAVALVVLAVIGGAFAVGCAVEDCVR